MNDTGVATHSDSPMEQSDSATLTTLAHPAQSAAPSPAQDALNPVAASHVYVIGRVEPRLPSLAVEKEIAQVVGRGNNSGLTDREALIRVLDDPANRYLARRLCWVLTVENLDTYVLVPRDPADLQLLVDAVRPAPSPEDVDVVIGTRGPVAPAELCGGVLAPLVVFDQLWSFSREDLIAAIPRPDGTPEDRFNATAEELLNRVLQLADNAGATDEHRALNYLVVRYPAIYARTAMAHADNASLSSVDVRPSRLSGARRIVDVIFSYTNRASDITESSFVRVDITEEFPFLVSKLAPFYDR